MRVDCSLKNYKANDDGDKDNLGVNSSLYHESCVEIRMIDTDVMIVDGYELIEAIKNCLNDFE